MAADLPVPTGQPGPSEQDYLDAGVAWMLSWQPDTPETRETAFVGAQDTAFRAAVDSAFAAGWRAGYGQGRDDEAAGEECP